MVATMQNGVVEVLPPLHQHHQNLQHLHQRHLRQHQDTQEAVTRVTVPSLVLPVDIHATSTAIAVAATRNQVA